MEFEFVTVAKPVLKRTVNPFLEVVANLPVDGDAMSFEMQSQTPDEKKAVRVALRNLTEAGDAANVTVRRSTKESKGRTNITFWNVPKIVHGDTK